MRRTFVIALLALVALAACGDDDAETMSSSGSTASEETASESPDSTESTADTEPTDDTTDGGSEMTIEQPTEVVVTTDGINIRATEEQRFYGFGEPSDVIADVSEVLGEPTSQDEIPDCSAGPAEGVYWERADLQLVLQEGDLVGWTLGEQSTVATDDALAIGSTLEEIQLRHGDGVTVDEESTLGIEFFVEEVGLSGLLTDATPEGTITAMWAGTVCTFR